MLDLHYVRTIVLNVEVENRKSQRKKPVHNHTNALGAFKRVLVISRSLLSPSTKLNVLGGRLVCFLNVTVPARGYLRDPHLPQMLLKMP